jgi:hypothetical protein
MTSLNPFTRSGPISPKAHGAWLGAGSGVAIANVAIGLIESYITHKPLPVAAVAGINLAVTPLIAFIGSWLAPLLAGLTAKQAAAVTPAAVTPAVAPVVAPVAAAAAAGGTPAA